MDLENGRLQHIGSVPSLPDDWQFTPSGAAIRLHPSLPFLYVSNRNGGIITVFRIGNEAAPLHLVDTQRVDDPTPRDFNISPDGKWLLLAGQQSHRLIAHPINLASGRIGPASVTVPCGSPVCIAWLPQ
jgi:6-phosphogluconolactonase